MKQRILVVEDEDAVVELLRYNLEKAGFDVAAAGDGEEALSAVADDVPDLLILDWMLPHLSGIEVCRQIRRRPETRDIPVLMLTARGSEADRVRGLDCGADDYVAKPFSTNELMARVRALLRRAKPAEVEGKLSFGGVEMDLGSHRVSRAGRSIHLGPTEFRLLKHLMERPGRVLSREQLLDSVWGRDIYVEPRTVDVHVRRLRKALNGPDDVDIIRTVRAAGYSLDETTEEEKTA
ncbi:MAG: phosphate regulon transcriptional regulatory protein PhoB [Rhodospirillaceae bacterium]|nr:phosphate regulon transcriptional regulatory protein PhoB [Rhodospirillaceae bacterium]